MNDRYNVPDRRDMTLRDFVDKYTALQGEGATTGQQMKAARFAVCGRLPDNKWASIDIERNQLGLVPQPPEVKFTRDYDSMIGFGPNLSKVVVDLSIFPNPNPVLNLSKDVHVRHTYFNTHEQAAATVSPHKIPNTLFATFGLRHSIRIHFPRLVNPQRGGVDLNSEELTSFYDNALRPAIERVQPGSLHDWPASFNTAQFRDMRKGGGFSNSSVLLSHHALGEFDLALRGLVDTNPNLVWARDYFWGFEIRGLKQVTKHKMGDLAASAVKLDHLFKDFDAPDENWYVDVGLEIGMKGKALAWLTRGHARIVQEALGVVEAAANRIVANNAFAVDMSNCLEQLAGFRTALLSEGVDLAVYLQAYLSEKAQTYHVGGGLNYRFLSVAMALLGNPPTFCRNLLQVIQDASKKLDVLLRIEVRVPFPRAALALQTFRRRALVNTIASFPRRIWWDYKATRLFAATFLISYLNGQTVAVRRRASTEVLIFGLTFLINALSHRLDDHSSARDLIRCIAPLTNNLQHSNLLRRGQDAARQLAQHPEGVPWMAGGIFVLRDITLPPTSDPPRFILVSEMAPATYLFYAGCSKEQSARRLYKQNYQQQVTPPTWVPARKGMTHERPDHPREDFRLVGPALPSAHFAEFEATDLNGDIEILDDNEFGEPIPPNGPTMADAMRKILDQAASDWIQKVSGSIDDKVSYCLIPQPHRTWIDLADINTLNLERFFEQVQYRRASHREWNKIIECLIWPHARPIPKSNTQLRNSLYHGMYTTLLEQAPANMRESITLSLQKELGKLPWLPFSKTERIWYYDRKPVFNEASFKAVPHARGGGPRIAINPKAVGVPSWIPNAQNAEDLLLLRREEEESSEAEDDAHPVVAGAIPFDGQPRQLFEAELRTQGGRGRYMGDIIE